MVYQMVDVLLNMKAGLGTADRNDSKFNLDA
jgi:hypothetical protein